VRTWPGGVTAITLFVDDLAATRRFYLDVFELPVVFENEVSAVFRFGATLVNLLRSTEAPQLIGPARVADRGSGARSQLTLDVDDVDATCARLVGKGVALVNGPMDRPWGIRTAAFADPGGHIWEIAQTLVTSR
jgi:catechol 2,3-dioxygenase-like lactoylglutathione lyase family enzyme